MKALGTMALYWSLDLDRLVELGLLVPQQGGPEDCSGEPTEGGEPTDDGQAPPEPMAAGHIQQALQALLDDVGATDTDTEDGNVGPQAVEAVIGVLWLLGFPVWHQGTTGPVGHLPVFYAPPEVAIAGGLMALCIAGPWAGFLEGARPEEPVIAETLEQIASVDLAELTAWWPELIAAVQTVQGHLISMGYPLVPEPLQPQG